jgi:hypothetical protein
VLLAHAGNRIDSDGRIAPRFPEAQVGPVTAVVSRLLADLRPSAVVSSAANGADLVVLTEAQRLGISTHVVLPLTVNDFRERSVETSNGRWAESYDRVLDVATTTPGSSVEMIDLGEDDAWYLAGNRLILDLARHHAGDGEAVVALTVRPPEGEDPPSATDDFARRAGAAGLTVLTLDPRPKTDATVLVT